jgi:hypothetical protein
MVADTIENKSHQEQTLTDTPKPLIRWKILALFSVTLLVSSIVSGIAGYYLHQYFSELDISKITKLEDSTPPTTEKPPVDSDYQPSTQPTHTPYKQFAETGNAIAVENLEALKVGFPSESTNPELELFVFADLTEEGFSGRILTQAIPLVRAEYGERVRVWYLHTVLPYRENSNLLSSIGTLKCLADKNSVWTNMENLVNQQGSHDFIYDLPEFSDQEDYIRCITEINGQDEYVSQRIKLTRDLMQRYTIGGVPTVLAVHNQNPDIAVPIVGALPSDIFLQKIEDLLAN